MKNRVKLLILALAMMGLAVGVKSTVKVYEGTRVAALSRSILNNQTCNDTTNVVACSHDEFLKTATYVTDPLMGQEFLAGIVKKEIEYSPEKARFLKDQYFIYTADLYIRTLKQRQNSVLSHLSFLNQYNVKINLAKTFLKGMDEYSNRREVDRAIASETILQEVSNFNSSMDELSKLIGSQ